MKPPETFRLLVISQLEVILLAISYVVMVATGILCATGPIALFVYYQRPALVICYLFLLPVGVAISTVIFRSLFFLPVQPVLARLPVPLSIEPRLESFIAGIAKQLGQQPPNEVRLLAAPELYLLHTGGFLGFGTKRCLCIGLPFLAGLTESELWVAISNELIWSAYSGETRHEGKAASGRGAFIRVLASLNSNQNSRSWVLRHVFGQIFLGAVTSGLSTYWKAVLAASQFLSRQRVYRMDDLTCYFAGAAATISALRRMPGIKLVNVPFWQHWVTPAVNAGFRPALVETFQQLLADPSVDRSLEAFLKQRKAARNDSHPPLSLRLERLAQYADPPRVQAMNSNPASGLIKNWENLEVGLLQLIHPRQDAANLRRLDWDAEGAEVFVPGWKASTGPFVSLLNGKPVTSLPALLAELAQMGAKIPDPRGQLLTRDQRTERAYLLLTMALGLRLREHGWNLNVRPGLMHFSKGGETLKLDALMARLRSGEMKPAEWKSMCEESGLAGVDLNGEALTEGGA
jgi:Zn-dependent protease with chaperone function